MLPPPSAPLESSRRSQTLPAGSTTAHTHRPAYEGQPLSKIRRKTISPRDQTFSFSQTLLAAAVSNPIPSKLPSHSPLLKPCHICYKGPVRKKDLDSYRGCLRCEHRTCYVCMRQCTAGSCGNRKICSSCCIEQGEEGDACCLDCLSRGQNFDMDMVEGSREDVGPARETGNESFIWKS